ncbi:signal recognition particle subunit SRP72-like [Convolutriloba macropyga]|uniref:signal recognition particle subunit SRP72-like n=1 Tax=Convolutriloba macropyga TaxID=536237 RepID=UPI003F522EFD
MGKQEEINPDVVYGNVLKFFKSGDYEKALSNARKIGRQCRDDKVAQECIAICCLQLDRYEDCIDVINKKKLALRFEKAYCLYRMNKTVESYDVLKAEEDLDTREKELLAQILYRLEKFDDCIAVYDDLIKNVHDDHDEERLSNYAAVLAAREQSQQDGKFPSVARAMFSRESDVAYELLYNEACGYAASGDLDKANSLLESSIKEFTDTNADELTEEEMNQELAVIRTELGYVLQMLGRKEEAVQLYDDVTKACADDPGVSATVACNLLNVNKSSNVNENKRRVKAMTATAGRQKLSSAQKKLMDYNLTLFYLNNNQIDACRKSLLTFTDENKEDNNLVPLLTTALMARDKKYKEAVEYLYEFPHLDLVTAQVYVLQGTLTSAVNTLKVCRFKNSMAIVSALVSLYLSFEEIASAEEIVNQFLISNPDLPKEHKVTILKGITNELMERKLYAKSIAYYEKLLDLLGPESEILAQLITCSAKVDTSLVKKYSKNLISIEELANDCDIEELSKSSELFLTNKYALKKAAKVATNQSDNVLAKKTKRKKKPRLPKNFDPNVQPDPERWLPKWERSAFKKSRKKKAQHDVGKGTQGGTTGGNVYDHSGPKVTVSAQPVTAAPEAPKTNTGVRPKTGGQQKRRGGKKR